MKVSNTLPLFVGAALMVASLSFAGPWGQSVMLDAKRDLEEKQRKEQTELKAKSALEANVKTLLIENARLRQSMVEIKLEVLALRQILKIDDKTLSEEKLQIHETRKRLSRILE